MIRIQLSILMRIRIWIQFTVPNITRIHADLDPNDGGLYLEGCLDGVLGQHRAVELHRGQGQLLHKHAHPIIREQLFSGTHRLTMDIDLQSLIGLLCTAVRYSLAETLQHPPPPAFLGSYKIALGQPTYIIRHLFENP
jgi:hypothetical protein